MRKTTVLVIMAAAIFVLAGCVKKTEQNKNENQNQGTVQNQEGEQGGVINSIKDAIGMGKKMKCTYTMKIGSETNTYVSYIEGKKHKSESEFDGKTQYSVFDGKIMYSWNNQDKNGTKMEIDCIKDLDQPSESETPKNTETPPALKDPDEQFDDAMDTKCESVASIDFSIPSDVNFKDQCEEMKKMMENLKKYQDQLPAGMPNVPGNPSAGNGNFAE